MVRTLHTVGQAKVRRTSGATPTSAHQLWMSVLRPTSGGMGHVRSRDGYSSSLVGASSTGRLVRLGVPRSHQSIGGAPCSWPAVTWTLPMLQNFQSSFAAREYWNKIPSTSEALSSPLRN